MPRKRSIPVGSLRAGSHLPHFRHFRKNPDSYLTRGPVLGGSGRCQGACLRSRCVSAGVHVLEMAADPVPPSAMASPGALNLNNEVSARAESVGRGPPCQPPTSPATRAPGGARPPRTRRAREAGVTRGSGPLSVRRWGRSRTVWSLLGVLCKMKLTIVSSSQGCEM